MSGVDLSLAHVQVGDTLTVRIPRYRGIEEREAVVTKKGRLYLYLRSLGQYQTEYVVHISTGREKDAYTHPVVAGTPETFAAYDRLRAAQARIEVATRPYHWYRMLTIEELETVADIIEAASQRVPTPGVVP